jgi:hypothetical protein
MYLIKINRNWGKSETYQDLDQDEANCFAENPAGLEEKTKPDELDFTE